MQKEEIFNVYSHLIGTILSVIGGLILLAVALYTREVPKLIGSAIYSISLVALFLASTMYHSRKSKEARDFFRKFDFAAIFLLIAGTYTPFMLVFYNDRTGQIILGIVWALALIGSIAKFIVNDKHEKISIVFYMLTAWTVLIDIKTLFYTFPISGLLWILAGGAAYMIGVYFFTQDHKIRYNHAIWHVFVLLGAFCHYIAVLFYVVYPGAEISFRDSIF